MSDAPQFRSAAPSRRFMLLDLAAIAGGAAILGITVSRRRLAVARAKMMPEVVGYQDKPKDAERCDNCLQFEGPASCKIVEGNIAASGWCKVYVQKPA